MNGKKLTRSRTDKFIGGVCGGLSAYFGVDANIVRIVMVLVALFIQPIGWMVYPALWMILPLEDGGPTGLDELKAQFGGRGPSQG